MTKKVTFNRRHWVRGALVGSLGDGGPATFCALGFYLNQVVDVNPADMLGYGSPAGVFATSDPERRKRFAQQLVDTGAEWLVCPVTNANGDVISFVQSKKASDVIRANDTDVTGFSREDALRNLFANHGVEIEFI